MGLLVEERALEPRCIGALEVEAAHGIMWQNHRPRYQCLKYEDGAAAFPPAQARARRLPPTKPPAYAFQNLAVAPVEAARPVSYDIPKKNWSHSQNPLSAHNMR